MLVFLILMVLCCICGHILRLFFRGKTASLALIRIGAVGLIILGGFSFILMMIFSGSNTKWLSRQQLDIFMLCIPPCLLIAALHLKRFRKKLFVIPLICLCLVGIGLNIQSMYIKSIPTVSTKDEAGYSPYDKRLEAYELDHPASFHPEGALPKLDGATALYPVYASFYRAVYPQTDDWASYIACSTTNYAYMKIINGSADVIFVAEASDEQAAAAREAGVELVFTPIGSEAFVFIVNSSNPLKDITVSQIRQIYRGELTEWSQLGISGLGKIRAFQRTGGSGSQTAFEKMIARGEDMPVAQIEEIAASMGGMYDTIADYRNYKNAIGYSFRYYCTEMLGSNRIRLLNINGISPTLEHIADGSYPFSGYFYAVTRADAPDNVNDFVRWMNGPEGQQIISNVGYLPMAQSVHQGQ
ncbi:MAG: substrate-binding domain-containing protein [Clostridia bacterium]|nr:substrate-binding domain-containing protein [Clostridia bacterium]